nr:E3 ubiquitin-protein ligase RNF14 [Ipomoea batatas]
MQQGMQTDLECFSSVGDLLPNIAPVYIPHRRLIDFSLVSWRAQKRVPAPAACLTKCGGEEDHRVEGGGGIELRVPSDCGEGTSRTKEKEENGGVGVGVEEFDDVGRRLEELRLGVEEAELSEEQLRINDQAREDEVKFNLSIISFNMIVNPSITFSSPVCLVFYINIMVLNFVQTGKQETRDTGKL